MTNDMTRFARGEATLDRLEKERPDQLAHVRAWQGNATIFRAVLAYKAAKPEEGDRLYAAAQARYDEAAKLAPNDSGVWAPAAAANAFFADQLPADKKAASWAKSYDFYQKMGAQQMGAIDKLPSHLQGEMLAGLVMSAQRTGRQEEYTKYLDQMVALTAKSPYGKTARLWKEDPSMVERTNLMCRNCHDAGRLEVRKVALAGAAR